MLPVLTDVVLQVTKVRCMKCEVWGHSHTDKNCPKYGKARDSEQPILQVRLKGIYMDRFTMKELWLLLWNGP